MAIRMAFALQLHKDLEYDPLVRNGTTQLSFIDREIRRRTFWACFLMDRFNSSGTDRPMFIREESIKIQLPIKERHFQLDIPGPTENLHGDVPHPVSPDNGELADAHDNMGVAAYMIRSIALWGRIISYLNQGGKEQDPHPMWSPESEYARLIAQTEELETNLPESLRYSAENLRLHDTEAMANQFLFLHISIQQNILFMNRFAVAAPGALAHLDGVPVAFTTKAGGRAFQAANRISELLKDAESYFVAAPFVGYCAFLSSTVHIFGAFSGNRNVEQTSKRNLATNVRFLAKMKRYWGMFHWMSENLREQYRVCADAARQAAAAGTTGAAAGGAGTGSAASGTGSPGAGKDGSDATGTATSTASGVPPTTAAAAVSASSPIFQYGDWFDRYPHGVSQSDFVDPATRKNKEKGDDAVLEQRPELHTVEEFFTTLSPPQSAEGRDVPMTGTASNPGGGSGATGGGATGGNTAGSAASGGNRPSLLQQRKSIVGSAKKPPGAATTGTTGGAVGRADPGQLQPIVTDMANATAATLQQQQQQQQDQQQHSQQQQPHGGAMHPRAPHRTFSASRGLQTSGPGAPFNPLTIPHSANSTGYGVALSPISPVTHGHHGPPSATFYSPDLLAMSLAAGGHPLAGGPHGGPGGPGAAVMLPTQLDRQLVFGAYGADPGALGTPADVAAAAAAAAAASQGLSLDGTAVPWDNMPPTPGGSRPQAPQQQRQRANSMRSIGSDHHAHVGHHALHAAHHHQPPPHHHPAMHPHHPAAHHAAIAAHHAQTDPTAAAAAAAFDASSAWFMPFNMEPPEIGHDMAMGGPGGGAMSGPGVGSGTLDAFAGMFATGAAAGPGPGGPRMHPGGGH